MFFLLMAVVSLLYILSAVYEWKWIRKLERYDRKRMSWETARVLYLITGIGGLGFGVAGVCSVILSSNSPILIGVGLFLAYLFANTLFNYQNNQSIVELFKNIRK